MLEGEPSQTSLHVAGCRAAHLRYDPPPHLLEDTLAEALLGPLAEELISSYSDERASWILRENRLFIPFRARYAEDRLVEAWRSGVRQLVVLGAGLDSYAFRRPEEQAALRVFEVDHPDTQAWKRARTAELGWALPKDFRFVACDFETTSASRALRDAGFAAEEPALVTWLGVTYYLAPETTRSAIVDLYDLLAPGSEVVLDYMFPLEDLPERYRELQQRMVDYLKGVGEPQSNRYRTEDLRKLLLEVGFAEVHTEEPDAIFRRYYAPLTGETPMSERFGIAVARR